MLTNIIKADQWLFRPVSALAVVFLLAACSSAPKKTEVVEVSAQATVDSGKPVLLEQEVAQFKSGVALITEKSYLEAEAIFNELLSKHPKLAGAYVNLGLIRQAQEQNDEARAMYSKALEINPKNLSALIQLSLINQSEGKFKESERLLITAHQHQMNNAHVNYNLGILYELYLQDYSKAIKHYRLYLQNSSDEDTKIVEGWIKILERK